MEAVRVEIIFQTVIEVVVHIPDFYLQAWFIIEILNTLITFITLIPFTPLVPLIALIPVIVWIIVHHVAHHTLIPLVPLIPLIPLVAVRIVCVILHAIGTIKSGAAVQPPKALAVPVWTALREGTSRARLHTPAQPLDTE